jgi:hypothetical protein
MFQEPADPDLMCFLIIIVSFLHLISNGRLGKHNSKMTGAMYCDFMLSHPNDEYFREMFRMDKQCFKDLLELLNTECGLEASYHISVAEKIMIFIYIISGTSYRKAADRFQHSGSTITKVVHEVTTALFNNSDKFLVKPTLNGNIDKLMDDKYSSFGDCIGALDGSHIVAIVPTDEQRLFRNRKGILYLYS